MNDHRLDRIEKALEELARAQEAMTKDQITAFMTLSNAINNLALKIDLVRQSVPIKVVAMMFGILVLAISGIQGSTWFFQTYLKP